ncbi:MAG: hypothetical protein L6420_04255 [Elusimicrobia bacterium]|nr:hypothetical protein [Elusimicrobiota bacterium]
MKKSILSVAFVLIPALAIHIFAEVPKAMDQLTALAPQQENLIPSEAKIQKTAVVLTEKGLPVRTIFFEIDEPESISGNTSKDGNKNGYNDDYGSYGRRSCIARDTGWEEHWGGHGGGPSELDACRECLSEHGSCRYTCSMQQFRCTAQFNPAPVDPNQPLPNTGTYGAYTGDLRPDEGSARDSAILRCMQFTQYKPGYCLVTTCNQESQIVKSGTCRR